jgi:hypothetical protein
LAKWFKKKMMFKSSFVLLGLIYIFSQQEQLEDHMNN